MDCMIVSLWSKTWNSKISCLKTVNDHYDDRWHHRLTLIEQSRLIEVFAKVTLALSKIELGKDTKKFFTRVL